MKPKKIKEEIEHERGSGNVFADLGVENPEEDLAKSTLIAKISRIIRAKKLTQIQVAKILGVNQPRISSLLSGNLDLFSLDMLMDFLKSLGQDVEIMVRPKPSRRKQAHLSVTSYSERSSFPMAAKARQ
jgi:predicted XRE-type DNA-binding protein